MEFIYEPALQEYMVKKGRKSIVVEVVSSNNSDFEVTELYTHIISDKQAQEFKKKKFRTFETSCGEVLLPPYRLEYEEKVFLGIKSFLGFKYVTMKGITL